MANEGILNQISVGVEDEYGVAVAPQLSVPILASDGIRTEQDVVGVEAINTLPAQNKGFVRGVRNYPGNFQLNAYPNALGFFLLSALGNIATDLVYGESDVYEHVFTESVAKPSLSIEQVIGAIEERYAGYIASGFNFQFQVGQPVNLTTPGMAKTVADEEKSSPSYENLDVLKWDHITGISFDGEDLKPFIESGNIEYTNGLNTFHGFSQQNEPSAHYVENSNVTGSFTAFMDGDKVDALLAKFRDQDEVPIVVIMQGQSIGQSANASVQITIPRAVFNVYNTQLSTSYNQVSFDFTGGLHNTNGLIEIILINTHQAYEAD